MPDGHTGMPLVVDGENVVLATSEPDEDIFYGLSVMNHSGRHLFPYLVYFDPSDYSIRVKFWCLYSVTCFADLITQLWYHPPAPTIAAPLRPSSNLKLGFGEANAKAIRFSLANGINTDVTFLRLFVSTTYVDMSALEQQSLFLNAHRASMKVPPPPPIWDAWTYVLRTVRWWFGRVR